MKLDDSEDQKTKTKLVETSFLLGVTGISILAGFGMALAVAKKKDPTFFYKGMMASKELPESGGSLAVRALGWGTLYAVSGFSIFSFGIWKIMGFENLKDFRLRMGKFLPRIPQKENQGRSDFKSVQELLDYIIKESDKNKKS